MRAELMDVRECSRQTGLRQPNVGGPDVEISQTFQLFVTDGTVRTPVGGIAEVQSEATADQMDWMTVRIPHDDF